ncbi:hypothetical protein F5Y17DRAFT_182178 [Xylariaceae sp. FL0594]|nr:hypothetical protein F5Y17DRAFT_182178 [Xylariaceae sp. FL0594]
MPLTDEEIEEAAQKLAVFRQHAAEWADQIEVYAKLHEAYKSLKVKCEEETAEKQKYMQLVRKANQHPFVTVLIDGDGYIFHEDFFKNEERPGKPTPEGGSHAAQQLHKAIGKSLQEKGLEGCAVKVYVYANLTKLSSTLFRNNLATPDRRSLAPFWANFNSLHGLFDFVDAGEGKEAADFRIREQLRFYSNNIQCKHIYFAACHDAGYVAELNKFLGEREKITLIRAPGAGFHEKFSKLGLDVVELPGIFRSTPLESAVDPNLSTTTDCPNASSTASGGAPSDHKPKAPVGQVKKCVYFQAGKCRDGSTCRFVHQGITNNPADSPAGPSQSNSRITRQTDCLTGHGQGNFPQIPIDTPVDDFGEGPSLDVTRSRVGRTRLKLPNKKELQAGCIFLSRDRKRLDPYTPVPSVAAQNEFEMQSATKGYCNKQQLNGYCPNKNWCHYEHQLIPVRLLSVLEWKARTLPCTKQGKCRDPSCFNGHVCQNPNFLRTRDPNNHHCKMPSEAHQVDFRSHTMVRPGPPYHYPNAGGNTVSNSPLPEALDPDGQGNGAPPNQPCRSLLD